MWFKRALFDKPLWLRQIMQECVVCCIWSEGTLHSCLFQWVSFWWRLKHGCPSLQPTVTPGHRRDSAQPKSNKRRSKESYSRINKRKRNNNMNKKNTDQSTNQDLFIVMLLQFIQSYSVVLQRWNYSTVEKKKKRGSYLKVWLETIGVNPSLLLPLDGPFAPCPYLSGSALPPLSARSPADKHCAD